MCGLFLTVKFSCLFTAVAVLACLRSLISEGKRLKTSSDPYVTLFPIKHLCWQWRRLHEKTGANRATKTLVTSRRVPRMPPGKCWDLGSLKCYFLNFGDYFTEYEVSWNPCMTAVGRYLGDWATEVPRKLDTYLWIRVDIASMKSEFLHCFTLLF